MRALARFCALVIAAIAVVQWWQLADRAHHVVRMYRKFGEFPVDTTAFGLPFFLLCSLIGVAAGLAVTRFARPERGWPYQLLGGGNPLDPCLSWQRRDPRRLRFAYA